MDNLNEHNDKIVKKIKAFKANKVGVKCPMCGTELVKSIPERTLIGLPDRTKVECTSCSFEGDMYI